MLTKWVEAQCDNKNCTRNEDGNAKVIVLKADSFSRADSDLNHGEGWIVDSAPKKKSKHFCCKACKDEHING